MNSAKDKKLRNDIQQNCDGKQVAYGCEGTTYEMRPMLSVEDEAPKEWRCSLLGILHPMARTQKNRHEWLHNEAKSIWAG
jgi:hypothetical protein